jgi:hypothetical protein
MTGLRTGGRPFHNEKHFFIMKEVAMAPGRAIITNLFKTIHVFMDMAVWHGACSYRKQNKQLPMREE